MSLFRNMRTFAELFSLKCSGAGPSSARLTFEWFRYKVCGGLVLLDVVPLHDPSLLVESQVPGPARGLLPVQHGGIGDVVVLKHRLLELTLRGKMLLREGGRGGGQILEQIIKDRRQEGD